MGTTLGKITVSGDLPRAEAQRVLAKALGTFRACYEAERGKSPERRGRMVLELTVAPRGGVSLADVKRSTLGGGETEICVGRAARDLRFPARPPGANEATVTFPVDFNPPR